MNMPSGFGGLLRYDDEYPSKFKLEPVHVIAFVILIIAFSVVLRVFF